TRDLLPLDGPPTVVIVVRQGPFAAFLGVIVGQTQKGEGTKREHEAPAAPDGCARSPRCGEHSRSLWQETGPLSATCRARFGGSVAPKVYATAGDRQAAGRSHRTSG